MTIAEAIGEADAMWPNAYSTEQKARWLSRVESMVDQEIIQLRKDAPPPFKPFHEGASLDFKLIAPEPHDQLYIYWLEAMIHYADNETLKYNNARAMFQAAFDGFKVWYARHHRALDPGRFRF